MINGRMASYTSRFNKEWLTHGEFKDWIQEVPNDALKARCSFCDKTVELSNMGSRALKSHAKSSKHKNRYDLFKSQMKHSEASILSYCNESSSDNAAFGQNSTEVNKSQEKCSNAKVTETFKNPSNRVSLLQQSDAIAKAEIRWALKTVTAHFSYNASKNIGSLFHAMFPDSNIAKSFKCSSTKIAYLVAFGIAPYFRNDLIEKIHQSENFVVSFDESLNKITQTEQMDIVVHYFEGDSVMTRYLDSSFLGHTRAIDLLDRFNEATSCLNYRKMLQISMDGPNVNWKFLEELNKNRNEKMMIYPCSST